MRSVNFQKSHLSLDIALYTPYSETERRRSRMTIKDVEQLTGITRQNIRFYEREGLIAVPESGEPVPGIFCG